MNLTEDLKAEIDAMTYEEMLRQWRFSPCVGSTIFLGPSGDYFKKVMDEKKAKDPEGAVRASKNVGWEL